MKVRLGFVAMAIDLKNCSPSKTITFKQYNKITNDDVKLYKLKKITKENLNNTKRILLYNIAHDIKVYRISSKLVPLTTHPDVIKWDYTKECHELFNDIGKIIKENKLRISAHPDHFTILSSPKSDVLKNSIKVLEYHNDIMLSIGLDPNLGKLVLHVGGKYEGKEKTKERFISNFKKLHNNIKDRIIIENDDKVYDIVDILEICEELGSPMVMDVHHQWCNNRGENLKEYLERIFNTWNREILIPKVHISSSKSDNNIRAHADDIDFKFFYNFILNRDFDIMIEAKNKNIALLNLMKKIKNHKEFRVIDNSTFEY